MKKNYIFPADYQKVVPKERYNFKESYEPYDLNDPFSYFTKNLISFPVSLKLIREFDLNLPTCIIFSLMRDMASRGMVERIWTDSSVPGVSWRLPDRWVSKMLNISLSTLYYAKNVLCQIESPLLDSKMRFTINSISSTEEFFKQEAIFIPYRAFCYKSLNLKEVFIYFYLYFVYQAPQNYGYDKIQKQNDYMGLDIKETAKILNIDHKALERYFLKLNEQELLELYRRSRGPWFYKPLVSLEEF